MVEKALDTFINSIINYFKTTYAINVSIGAPYLINDAAELGCDYTGAINISGEYEGSCYFSTPKALLQQVLKSLTIHGEFDTNSDQVLSDIAGEIANTLSGNARADLGEDFIISIPKIFRGKSAIAGISEAQRVYAIPINWNDQKAFLGVHLK